MSLKAKVEAIIYAAEEPVTLEQIALLLNDVVLADLSAARQNAAMAQADSDAEAEAGATGQRNLLPVLVLSSPGLLTPEPGPLMPPEDEPGTEPSESAPENPEDASEPEATSPPSEALAEPAEHPEEADAAASDEPTSEPSGSASLNPSDATARKRQPKKSEEEIAQDKAVRARLRQVLAELVTDYASQDRGMEIRQVAGGFRMATKPEHHDVVRAFAKSLKPPIRLSLAALETLAVIAYKQPVTAPEISDIRGVESASVLGTLLDRKLIITAGRKQVIGRPIQYKTSKDFLLRFGLNDVNELPSMEEFSQLASDGSIEIAPLQSEESPSLFETAAQPPLPSQPSTATAPEDAPAIAPAEFATESPDTQPQSEAEAILSPETGNPIGH
jgi:segregation and condensation protein B